MGAISGENARAWWYSPCDGSASEIGFFPNEGERRFDPPGSTAEGIDRVLVLDDASSGSPPPGED